MDILKGTYEHSSKVPLRAMLKSTPRANTKHTLLL